jgi:hypothetical protein
MLLDNAFTSIAPKYTQNYLDNSNQLFASNKVGGGKKGKKAGYSSRKKRQTKKSKRRCNRTMKRWSK